MFLRFLIFQSHVFKFIVSKILPFLKFINFQRYVLKLCLKEL
jgi:hypothetical protein